MVENKERYEWYIISNFDFSLFIFNKQILDKSARFSHLSRIILANQALGISSIKFIQSGF